MNHANNEKYEKEKLKVGRASDPCLQLRAQNCKGRSSNVSKLKA
jgi:hypothetical protein